MHAVWVIMPWLSVSQSDVKKTLNEFRQNVRDWSIFFVMLGSSYFII